MTLTRDGARQPPRAVGVASAQILEPRAGRQAVLFVNDSAAIVYVSKGEAAVVGSGIRLNPNGGSYSEPDNRYRVWQGAWNAIATVAGSNLCVNEDW